jgi:tetratricopeptide (TPR) repeat protein/mono/diheme cytochrome c family protein
MPLNRRSILAALASPSLMAGFAAGPLAQTPHVTFNHDIAPIVSRHCSGCHRPDGGAPFSLLTYEDVRRRAALVAQVTASGYMPPWKPQGASGEFVGERRLSETERALIRQWVEKGAPEGEPGAPAATAAPAREWQLGEPDVVIAMPEAFPLGAEGSDVFRTFVIPIPVTTAAYVRGIEFRPGAPWAVHHASLKIDRTRSSRHLDDDEAGPGYDGGGARTAEFPDGHFLAWTPGQIPQLLPGDMAWRLEPNSDLVLELHLMPTGKPEAVRATVGLFLTDTPPSRQPFIVRLGSQTLDIPAGRSDYLATDSFVLPVDVDVLAIQPHAHYLAREIRASATPPDGTTTPLLHIPDWDFRWQDVYRYREARRLPKGTTVSMQIRYDNSAANPRNPNQPPRRVTFGQTTSSEMGNLWIQVVARNGEERAALARAHAPKVLHGDIAGYEKMIEATPGDPRLHAELGFLYLAAGRSAAGVERLQESVRLAPDSALRHHALGTVLLNHARLDEAKQHLGQAVRLDPKLSEAHNNLGLVSHAQGKFEEAIASYGEAIRASPGNADAQYNLGRAHAALGNEDEAMRAYRRALAIRPDDPAALSSLAGLIASKGGAEHEAVALYRRALKIDPDFPSALVDLAWMLATSERQEIRAPAQAVRLAQRVAELTGHQNATALETLAVAYFSAGRTPDAIRTAAAALDIATRAGATELASALRKRLEQYKRR